MVADDATRSRTLRSSMTAVLLLPATLALIAWSGGGRTEPAHLVTPAAPITMAPPAAMHLSPVPAEASRLFDLAVPFEWESFTARDGLPANEVFAIRIDGDRIWAGTKNGLAVYEKGRWRSYGVQDGLPHKVILSLDVSPRTGDLWIGTMGGLARYSAGRFDTFTQMNSGLPNDFVHAVRCDPDEDTVWAATAMGAGRLDLKTGEWSIFTQANTPMHEPWTYAIGIGDGLVYIGAWGAGVLEYTKATGSWRPFRDPDKEFEIDLLPDDGPVSDVTSSVDYAAGILWQSSYTGLARYEGREWRTWFAEDSGLASNFINFVRARGRHAWLATDQGLSLTDGDDWITWKRLEDGRGEILLYEGDRRVARRVTGTTLAHNYILGVDADEHDVWVATGHGVSHGVRRGTAGPLLSAERAANPPSSEKAADPAAGFRYARTPEALAPYHGMDPHKRLFTERSQFRGAGREGPDPQGLSEVRIGFIGPLTDEDRPVASQASRSATSDPLKAVYGRRMLQAATMAVEQANKQGGYRGIPFRIVPRTDLVLWGQTSNELVRFVEEDGVWAVLSSIDSNHNHVLSRSSLKIEVPVVNAGSTDPTLVEHSIPWLVRCIADDRQLSYSLLHEVFRVRGHQKVAVLRLNDRDGRVGIGEFVDGARRLGRPILIEQRFAPGERDFREPIERIRETGADAVVLWGNPEETGAAVKRMRELKLDLPVFGFDRMTQASFLKAAGEAADGVVVAATMNPESRDPEWLRFRQSYKNRWAEEPDTFATHAYDGMNLILSAIRKAGLNRARVRDELFAMKSWPGASGEIVFDTNMSNIGPTWLAVARDGRFTYTPAQPWEEPQSRAPSVSAGGKQP